MGPPVGQPARGRARSVGANFSAPDAKNGSVTTGRGLMTTAERGSTHPPAGTVRRVVVRPRRARQDVARAALRPLRPPGLRRDHGRRDRGGGRGSRGGPSSATTSPSPTSCGEFDAELGRLRDRLAEAPEFGARDGCAPAVRSSPPNRFGAGELDELRIRIVLISTVPTLVAHSAVRYEEWCEVVAGFAGRPARGVARRPRPPDGGTGGARRRHGRVRLLGPQRGGATWWPRWTGPSAAGHRVRRRRTRRGLSAAPNRAVTCPPHGGVSTGPPGRCDAGP